MFNIIGIEYNKCKRISSERQRLARSTYNLISYWLMKTWPGTILQQQLRYGVVVLTFSFLQRCALKLKTTQAELIVLHATCYLPTRENILTTGMYTNGSTCTTYSSLSSLHTHYHITIN